MTVVDTFSDSRRRLGEVAHHFAETTEAFRDRHALHSPNRPETHNGSAETPYRHDDNPGKTFTSTEAGSFRIHLIERPAGDHVARPHRPTAPPDRTARSHGDSGWRWRPLNRGGSRSPTLNMASLSGQHVKHTLAAAFGNIASGTDSNATAGGTPSSRP